MYNYTQKKPCRTEERLRVVRDTVIRPVDVLQLYDLSLLYMYIVRYEDTHNLVGTAYNVQYRSDAKYKAHFTRVCLLTCVCTRRQYRLDVHVSYNAHACL